MVTVLTIINNFSLQSTFPYLVTLCSFKICDIYLFPCFCPICVNLFFIPVYISICPICLNLVLMSDVCLFPMYAHYFPASNLSLHCLALLHLLEFCAAAPFYVFTCFLF